MTQNFWWWENLFNQFGHAYKVELVFEHSGLQKIQILKNSYWGYFLVLDGIVQFTERDEFIYHEIITHFPLCYLEKLERVLIIGGADGGVLRELQKNPIYPEIKEILQFEIDEFLFNLCAKYFYEMRGNYKDSKVKVFFEEGFKGVKKSESESFDLIIVDSTDPVGPAKTLYSEEFYKEIFRILKPHGIFIQQTSLPVYFPEILKNTYFFIRNLFPSCKVLRAFVPCYGEEISFCVASKSEVVWEKPKNSYKGKFFSTSLLPSFFAISPLWESLLKS